MITSEKKYKDGKAFNEGFSDFFVRYKVFEQARYEKPYFEAAKLFNDLCSSDKCRSGLIEFLKNQNYEKVFGDRINSLRREGLIQELLVIAKSKFLSNHIKPDELKKSFQTSPLIISFLKRIGYSSETKKVLRDTIEKALIVDFNPKKEVQSQRELISSLENYLIFLKKGGSQSPLHYLIRNVRPPHHTNISFRPSPLSGLFDLTGGAYENPTVNPSQKHRIIISDSGANNPESITSIFYHELGHMLSFLVKKNLLSQNSRRLYLRQRKCVADRDKSFVHRGPRFLSNFENDFSSTEEAMADFIMAKTTNPSKIFFCSRLEPDSSLRGYQNLNFIGNSHYSNFHRVLLEATDKRGRLSKACEEIKMRYSDVFSFHSCSFDEDEGG